MLYMYRAELLADLPHPTFYQGLDPNVEGMLFRPPPSPPTINMWLYFWHMPIDNPSTIISYPESRMIDLHPGLNRFIGRGLRGEGQWLDARLISNGQPWRLIRPGIRVHEQIDTLDHTIEIKNLYASENKPVWDWSVGKYSPERNTWFDDVPAWVQRVLGKYRAELVLATGKRVVLNPNGRRIISASVEQHNGFIPAVRALFWELDPIISRSIHKQGIL